MAMLNLNVVFYPKRKPPFEKAVNLTIVLRFFNESRNIVS